MAMLCFDSSAAVDMLSHDILLSKLKWFTSYLADRWQYCEIGGKQSTKKRITRGVFQGSVLGHLLYILYISSATLPHKAFTICR